MVDFIENINSRCWQMANLSPKVKSYLDIEGFHADTDSDQLDYDVIQQNVFAYFVSDLTDIGLTFTCDISELYESPVILDHILAVFLLDPAEYVLYPVEE